MSVMRALTAFIGLAACVGVSGCLDGGETSGPASPARVDSSLAFNGQKQSAAETVERFEAAVLDDDVETICRRLLAVEENRGYDNDNGGYDFCVRDPSNQPDRLIAAAGGADSYDLVVERVTRNDAVHGIDRFNARVKSAGGIEEFTLQSRGGEWVITQRDFSVDGESTRLAGEFDCAKGGHDILGVSYAGPRPDTNDPREAILLGPFGDRARKTIDAGGSLELASAYYRPDYHFMYVLRDERDRYVAGFPVTVWGPKEFDTYSMTFCRDGQEAMIII